MATQEQINSFINIVSPIIVNKCKEHGWGVPSSIVAQAGIESNWGTSKLGSLTAGDSCFNFWGMKWVSGCGCEYKEFNTKEQRIDGSYYTVVARFRKYPDIISGIEGYFKFIEAYKRYKPVMNAKDYNSYAVQLKACGWATALSYSSNIVNVVKKYGLQALDNGAAFNLSTYIIGRNYSLLNNMYVRNVPDGEKIKYDCLTQDGKSKGYFDDYGNAILKANTIVTCLEVVNLNDDVWIRIPSGYVCARKNGKIYIA